MTGSVWAIGKSFLDWFSIDVAAIRSPGVLRGGRLWGLDLPIEGLGIHNFSLADGFMEDGVGKGLVFVEYSDFSFGILANGDLCIAQSIIWAVGLDLIDYMIELHRQVFRECTGLLMGEDHIQIFSCE